MSRKSPKHARKTVRRGAVAAGAIAATAAMTIAVPTGAANAAPTRNPQIDGLLAAAPYAPGLLTSAGILAVAPRITQLTDAYAENVPVLPGLFPVSNSARPIVSAAGLLPYTHTPNWTGVGAENVFSAGAPFGLGGVTNTTYGMTGIYSQLVSIPGPLPLPPIAIPAGTGSTAGNVTAITGPLGSALNLQSSLTSVVGLDGNTTWTPALGLGGTFPLGLGTARATIVPVTVTYGEDTFLVGLPVINLGLNIPGIIDTSLAINLGQIGFQDGNLVLTTPTMNANLDTPLGGGEFNLTPGTVSVGTGGLNVSAPGANGNVNILDTVTAEFAVTGGEVEVTPTGATVTGPTIEGEVDTPLGGGSTTVETGGGHVGTDGASVTGPDVTAEVSTPVGVGGNVDVDTGSGSVGTDGTVDVTGPSGEAELNTPAGDVGGGVDTGSVVAGPGTGVDVTGPSGEVSVTPAGGDTTTVEASTGGGSVDTDGDVDIDPPSVDVTD